MTLAGARGSRDQPILAASRRATLLPAYTAATIGAGILLLLLLTATVPLSGGIVVPGTPAGLGAPAGLALWIGFGLAGALRVVRDPSGHGALTFHLPFIVAAMTLGGPVAGGWVAMVSSFDRRELEEVPWYGIVANHASLALAAMAGGAVVLLVEAVSRTVGVADGPALALVAAIAGTLVFSMLSTALAAGVVVLRDGLTLAETLTIFDRAFRTTAVAETVLGWLLVVAWLAVGWWAPIACAVLVLAMWRARTAEERVDRDQLTGLLSRDAFGVRVAEAADRARRGIEGAAYLFIDLDGFKAVNDAARDHQAGDEVLVEVGRRLRRAIRVTDAAGRRSGDEFMVLFVGVQDEATAELLAGRVHDALALPYSTSSGEVSVGSSIGVALLEPGRRDFEPDVRQHADAAMYAAKEAGGGVRVWRVREPSGA